MGRNHMFAAASAAVIGMLLTPRPAMAGDNTVRLAPASPWAVDFGSEKCRLVRTFGEREDRHVMLMEQWGPGARFGFTVAGPAMKRFRSRRNTEVQFGRDETPHDTQPFTGELGSSGPAVVFSSLGLDGAPEQIDRNRSAAGAETGLPQLDIERAGEVEFIALQQRGPKVVFETGSLAEAFEVMNRCTQDLVRDWGFDVERQKSVVKRPTYLNVETLARQLQKSYPTKALYRGEQGMMSMRLTVEADGSVSDCMIGQATRTDSLETPACKYVSKAKFDPALDAMGQPVRSFYLTRITYRMND